MWMRGYNVLHPMGWDAFGLARGKRRHQEEPASARVDASEHRAHEGAVAAPGLRYSIGAAKSATCEPEYYRWNQWFFLKMFERGLAYRKEALLNWCPECGTVLANEQVVDGCCWRHETTPVEQRAMQQWFLKTTAYAPELLDAMKQLEGGWPDRVLAMQRNWIGRSEGAEVDFALADSRRKDPRLHHAHRYDLRRNLPDSCAGTSVARKLVTDEAERLKLKEMIDFTARQDPGNVKKLGQFTGKYAVHPFNGAKVPIWIGNFVLMGYGTGAIMAVPAHDERDFEFCREYGIPVTPVIRPVDGALGDGATMQGAVRRIRHR